MTNINEGRLLKGFVNRQILIMSFRDGVSQRVGELFMYAQQTFIEKVNKLPSCTAPH